MTNQNKDSNIDNDGWPITTDRYVAFIDIMGFKDMVARTNHIKLYELMKGINKEKELNESIKWPLLGSENDSDKNPKTVKSTMYSDSIIIYSEDSSLDSLHAIVCSVSSLVHGLFINNIPHKGALAYGAMTLDIKRSIFFGQPLIDAYLLQEELFFYGIVIHATAEKKIISTKKYRSIPFLNYYLCPFKKGNSKNLTICPIFLPLEDKHPEKHKQMVESISELRCQTSGHLRRYVDNTEIYHKKLIELESTNDQYDPFNPDDI